MRISKPKLYEASIPLVPTDEAVDASAPLEERTRRRIAVRVLSIQAGKAMTVPDDCSCVVVRASGTASTVGTVRTRAGEVQCVALAVGQTCSLDAGHALALDNTLNSALVAYEIPRTSFRSFAQHNAFAPINSFVIPAPVPDHFLHTLSRSIVPMLASRTPWSKNFAQHFATSLYLHLLERYGVQSDEQERSLGGLSPRNKALVEAILHASHASRISIETVAEQCQLSSRQFARAFQQTFGMPFYKLQLELRVHRAKQLLIDTELSLTEIASEVGYADQATFTESFARVAGMPPGRFRRQHQGFESAGPPSLASAWGLAAHRSGISKEG